MALRYQEIREELMKKILSMEPHGRIPSRNRLCRDMETTRTTVDRAVGELIRDGYLYAVDGSGTYVADMGASGASLSRDQRNVGVLLPNVVHDTYPGILRGIEDVMEKEDVNVVICNTDHDDRKQNSYIRRFVNGHIDGIIMVPAIVTGREEGAGIAEDLLPLRAPIVFCNRAIEGMRAPLVCSNNYYGGYIATCHLIEKGYRRVAYLSSISYRTTADRYYGYLSALWDAGIAPDERLILSVDEQASVLAGHQLMDRLLLEAPDADAAFCFNDQLALGALNAVREKGLRISGDIGVIGYDNTAACLIPSEKLSSVSFKKYEIGRRAAELIVSMIRHPERPVPRLTVFKPELCDRDSCRGPEEKP